MTDISYEDFVDTEYQPRDSELVCEFLIDPATGLSMADAAGRIASESSNGTWAKLNVGDGFTDVGATACAIDENRITVAYPEMLFEGGNMPQVLSCIAGNIMGMKAVDSIRLMDCDWPRGLTQSFPGPTFGSTVKSNFLDATDRPALATVPKPKVGLSTEQHAKIGYEAWTGGVDLLKDDENLSDQSFNSFADRVTESFEMAERAKAETGEHKDYLVNITADVDTMKERAKFVADHGGNFVMIDVITTGWGSVQSMRKHADELGLAIHAHRAMHAAFDRLPHHGVSMRVLAQIARLTGVDHIHTGTANLGKLANEDTSGINEWLQRDLHGLTDVLPVASGGLHPGTVEPLFDALGTNLIVQAGGGIHGHPDGTHEGAKALRQAVDAYMEGTSVEEAAVSNPALSKALDEWGSETPI